MVKTGVKIMDVLIVSQGFEHRITDFRMDDFRKDKLPNFPEPYNEQFLKYYRIEQLETKSRCPWGFSRWVTGENGKLKMLDNYWDSSG